MSPLHTHLRIIALVNVTDWWKNNLIIKQSGNDMLLVHFYQRRNYNIDKTMGRDDEISVKREFDKE